MDTDSNPIDCVGSQVKGSGYSSISNYEHGNKHCYGDKMTTVLQAQSLTKRYGEVTAVNDLSLEVCEGEVFGWPLASVVKSQTARLSPTDFRRKIQALTNHEPKSE